MTRQSHHPPKRKIFMDLRSSPSSRAAVRKATGKGTMVYGNSRAEGARAALPKVPIQIMGR